MMKNFFKALRIHTSFFQGVVVGLFLISTLSFAGALVLNIFTPGTSISANDMNANFNAIKQRIDSLEVGSVGKISSAQVVSCASSTPSYPSDYDTISMIAESNDGNFNDASHWYTIPETALYRIYLSAATEDGMGFFSYLEFSTDAGSTWTIDNSMIKKYAAGTLLRATAACSNAMGAGVDSTINASTFLFAIKKY